ncbi:MAG: type II secretion system inner membrane protein GspF [Desulfocapsaceae bacterium]|nr:type II secretion system inner membrane protein GspF [Desulfocapsaceae bacterium]
MPVYEYKALDDQGRSRKGIIDADSESSARVRIRTLGQYPVEIRESLARKRKTGTGGLPFPFLSERVRSNEIHMLTRQLATLLGAGIPLVPALSSLVVQTKNTMLKKVIAEIKESVNEGNSLTNAMASHLKFFSNVYVNMIRAGEASGSLDVVLERLADFGEKQETLKGRLKAALIYPAFMAIVGIGILSFLITYIVPNIAKVFTDMKHALPLPTLLLIGLSEFLKVYWWLVLLLTAGIAYSIRVFVQTEYGRAQWDLLKLKIPVSGSVFQKIILVRFASTLGSLLESNVGLITSMQIVKTIVNNTQIGGVVDGAIEQIRQGRSMTRSLEDSLWFPPMFVQMIAVGEQSGSLEVMLKKVSEAYERDVDTAIMGMTSLIEPLMIVIMGMAVGFVVLSILLPIFEMNQLVR